MVGEDQRCELRCGSGQPTRHEAGLFGGPLRTSGGSGEARAAARAAHCSPCGHFERRRGAATSKRRQGLGCDIYLTGETSHAEYYDALSSAINVIYGGHYATETVGVQALGQHLQDKFGLEFEFADLPTGL